MCKVIGTKPLLIPNQDPKLVCSIKPKRIHHKNIHIINEVLMEAKEYVDNALVQPSSSNEILRPKNS